VTWPLVSVITPTWRRRDLLLRRCIPSVAAQTYPAVEHVIVSDGPDRDLGAAAAVPETGLTASRKVRLVLGELAEHDPAGWWGHRARLRGIQLAHGDLIAWLDDDNTYRPGHLHRLASLLRDHPHAGFAYSRIKMHHANRSVTVGSDPPQFRGIDTSAIMHRREILSIATWRPVPAPDWDLVERWMQAGVTWAADPETTADYYFADWYHPPAAAIRVHCA
jgi:GT2 family glycosyltransferase